MRLAVDSAREHDTAIDNRDLLGVYMTRSKMILARAPTMAESSFDICRAIASGEFAGRFCDTGEPLPGGDYGVQLRSIFKRFTVEFGPRVTSFPPGLHP